MKTFSQGDLFQAIKGGNPAIPEVATIGLTEGISWWKLNESIGPIRQQRNSEK